MNEWLWGIMNEAIHEMLKDSKALTIFIEWNDLTTIVISYITSVYRTASTNIRLNARCVGLWSTYNYPGKWKRLLDSGCFYQVLSRGVKHIRPTKVASTNESKEKKWTTVIGCLFVFFCCSKNLLSNHSYTTTADSILKIQKKKKETTCHIWCYEIIKFIFILLNFWWIIFYWRCIHIIKTNSVYWRLSRCGFIVISKNFSLSSDLAMFT